MGQTKATFLISWLTIAAIVPVTGDLPLLSQLGNCC